MKLQRTTCLLIIFAAILGSWVYFYEIRGEQQKTISATNQQQIFNLTEAQINKIIIQKSNQTLEFERTGKNEQPWQMKQPQNVPANDATIAFLLDLITNGKSDRIFTVPQSDLSQYGLDNPIAHIMIESNNQTTQEIFLGQPSLNEELIYAYTPVSGTKTGLNVLLVSRNWQYAVDRELSEWQQNPTN
ncbi:hypothetical protein Sta7437_0467 [Stanieria cyanosphaera PCC 7437]|uniref:DUF4340 domain-containing protein n=1 Tax=Stanieria cyanosphaera (strain ATCC 29371 / PCC 7437) TaxID=111780 RepID=K9XNA7_STAC7|nr:DUF4340 domain-containing protein [Stanieria cyanosphaera]AFZ34075.1 hypothetical protein Sta7437_0467 [Stanieria cyanosphaera PCC 7437]